VKGQVEKTLLKGVSRSFYLTLRLLPVPMRGSASLGYLLARTSDTLADTPTVAPEARLLFLDWFDRALTGEEEAPRWPFSMLNAVSDFRERRLLEETSALFDWLGRLPAAEADLVREVVGIITGGQRLDLERFATANQREPVALEDSAALEDYTWRVAGCVGAFWTKLGFLTLGDGFSITAPADLIEMGIAYGKGLQLVNILRDLPEDLATGRCYLPVADPRNEKILMEAHQWWAERAWDLTGEGLSYAENLVSRRLRAATVLPAMLARKTLERLRNVTWTNLQTRVKVPRTQVYLALARALAG
jgi:farnesyl-diphosphate farnesyltransferase